MRIAKCLAGVSLPLLIASTLLLPACSGTGGGYSGTRVYHSTGYRHYHGGPWRDYRPIYVVPVPPEGEVDPDWGVDPGPGGPVAVPLPDMGAPDFDMDMMDFDF